MSHVPPPLPKAGTAPLRELWEQTKKALDLPRTVLVLEGAVDRKSLEEILQRLLKGAAARPGQMPRAELVGRLADAFHKSPDAAYPLMKELDRSCHKERHIVASIDEPSLDERLSTYRALDFRRERARLVWALVRDGREAPRRAADRILIDAFAQIHKAEEAHAAAAAGGATGASEPTVVEGADKPAAQALEQRLTSYERAIEAQQKEIQRAVGLKESVERERSELMARLGQRERALRDEEELRRKLEAESRALSAELSAARAALETSQPERLTTALAENERLRERVRALEQRAERAERIGALEEELDKRARDLEAERRQASRAREEFEEQLRILAAREKGALDRLQALREELKAARRQLAGEATEEPSASIPKDRVGVFVDAANLSASARREFGSKLDYRALLGHVVDGRPRSCAVAFVVRDGEEGAHHGFVSSLREGGYEIREKRPKARGDGSRKADWDMGIAMEILDQLDAMDVVVLCSGDGDFVPLVQRLRREGKRVEVAAFRASTDEALIKAVDVFVPLDGRFRMAT
jgi:uncharacterized LabA/DUF88 family protein